MEEVPRHTRTKTTSRKTIEGCTEKNDQYTSRRRIRSEREILDSYKELIYEKKETMQALL
jgi:hypothetical protein